MENKVGEIHFCRIFSCINALVHQLALLHTADIDNTSKNSEADAKLGKKLLRMITPSIDPDSWKNVETLMGIKLTQDSLAYAKITKEMVRSKMSMYCIL